LDYKANKYAALTGIIVLASFIALYFIVKGIKKLNA